MRKRLTTVMVLLGIWLWGMLTIPVSTHGADEVVRTLPALYTLVGDPFSLRAVSQVFHAKGREAHRSLPLLVRDTLMAEDLASEGDPADAIRAEQTFDGVHVQFLEYTDQEPSSAAAADLGEPETFRVRYRSNGTCRPYRVRISDDNGTALVLDVDMLGATVIEGEGDEQ